MKKLLIVLVVAGFSLSSCTKHYTCPTYLKDNPTQKDIKVDNKVKELKSEEKKS